MLSIFFHICQKIEITIFAEILKNVAKFLKIQSFGQKFNFRWNIDETFDAATASILVVGHWQRKSQQKNWGDVYRYEISVRYGEVDIVWTCGA